MSVLVFIVAAGVVSLVATWVHVGGRFLGDPTGMGAMLQQVRAEDLEIPDPLEEEFRALEDAVLKRDDPTAWMAKRGFPGLQLGDQSARYASLQMEQLNRYANEMCRQQMQMHQANALSLAMAALAQQQKSKGPP